ncbi:hypothetical protein H6G00_05120 [Leptolyngbya sp. FACHB-541]|uniref:hypothetical protein n=1 Tax=Leptolyngbya sp. FACHB-541 TaxID=2692810 RepID=UPI001684B74E|nr:hypothetical protein [Leptolyngbya sp. FACHB-541]MBD1995997.1 hypothetical protein [Leptolyngbya sp. FACHB-541]
MKPFSILLTVVARKTTAQHFKIGEGVEFTNGYCCVVIQHGDMSAEPKLYPSLEELQRSLCGDKRVSLIWL